MEYNINGILVTIIQKNNIRNVNVCIKVPHGKVIITAPKIIPIEEIKKIVLGREDWIRQQVEKIRAVTLLEIPVCETGAALRVWGKMYILEVKEGQPINHLELSEEKAVLSLKANTTDRQREAFVQKWYREQCKNAIREKLSFWEKVTGLPCASWQVRAMKTRWGSCNVRKRKINFNFWLVQADETCLDYVILHELVHLAEANHGARFVQIMDSHMPNWRRKKEILDGLSPIK
jgi:hypothetical protein